VSANEKTQLQKEGKLPSNMDDDEVPGANFESESDEERPLKKSAMVKKADTSTKLSPKASQMTTKKTSFSNKRSNK
jgi:hypothetical protein